jgi:hypothetical protein
VHVAIVREMRSLTKFRLGNVKGKGDLEDLGLNGSILIRTEPKDIVCCRQVPQSVGFLLNS